METRYAFLLTISLALVAVNFAVADSEVRGDLKTGEKGKILNVANEINSVNDEKPVIPEEKKEKDQAGDGSKKGAESNNTLVGHGEHGKVGVNEADNGQKETNDPGAKEKINTDGDRKPLESQGTGNEQMKTDNKVAGNKSNLEAKSTDKGSKGTGNETTDGAGSELKTTNDKDPEEKKGNQKGTEKDGETKEKPSGGSNLDSKEGTLAQGRKEGGEACDSSSNSCTIEEKSIVACLRVPGNESPELSLLIQNKGKGPVTVTISAPDFVKLEQKQVQLKENNNEKVMVSVGQGEPDSKIILKAENGKCLLDFKGMITQSSGKNPGFTQLAYINLVKNTSYVWFILLAAVLVIASAWIGISFRKKYAARNSPKYEKLEMELPVTGSSKLPAEDSNDGWDDNWDDNWDDEEVGLPTSLPVTPSFSPNGIASRRIIKDAWKD